MKRREPTPITLDRSIELCACGHARFAHVSACRLCECEGFSMQRDLEPVPCCHGWFPDLPATPAAIGEGAKLTERFKRYERESPPVLPIGFFALAMLTNCGGNAFSVAAVEATKPDSDVVQIAPDGTDATDSGGAESEEGTVGGEAEASTRVLLDATPDVAQDPPDAGHDASDAGLCCITVAGYIASGYHCAGGPIACNSASCPESPFAGEACVITCGGCECTGTVQVCP
jgi:hypothetical protein